MPLRRAVAELPESVNELCLVRFGLLAHRLSGVPVVRRYARAVEDAAAKATGLFHSERLSFGWKHIGFLQYWSSFDALNTWSHAAPHSDWWRAALDRMRTKGDIGVYHEAYVVPRSGVESIYLDCDGIGLARFGTLAEPIGTRTTARDRLGRRTV